MFDTSTLSQNFEDQSQDFIVNVSDSPPSQKEVLLLITDTMDTHSINILVHLRKLNLVISEAEREVSIILQISEENRNGT